MLMGLVDADYKFLWAQVGAEGTAFDACVFARSPIEPALREGTLGFRPADLLPNDDMDTLLGMIHFHCQATWSSHSAKDS